MRKWEICKRCSLFHSFVKEQVRIGNELVPLYFCGCHADPTIKTMPKRIFIELGIPSKCEFMLEQTVICLAERDSEKENRQ